MSSSPERFSRRMKVFIETCSRHRDKKLLGEASLAACLLKRVKDRLLQKNKNKNR